MRHAWALLCVAGALAAAPRGAPDAAREVAGEIAATVAARAPLGLVMRNISSLGAGEFAAVRRGLEAELRAHGIVAVPGNELQVSVSENIESFLLVAELRRGNERQVFLAEWPRSAGPPRAEPEMTLEVNLVVRRQAPILDVGFVAAGGVLVLGPGFVSLGEHSVSLPVPGPWPRDPRGRLVVSGNSFQAFLPGQTCTGAIQPEITTSCRASQDPWPLPVPATLALRRNYFETAAPPAGPALRIPPFFSAAEAREEGKPLHVVAALDGSAHLFDSAWMPAGSIPAWSGDIAGVESACGSGRQVVAIESGAASDSVRAFEVINREPIVVTAPLALPGRVTALWPAGGAAVLAVTWNSDTGEYAAFNVALGCGS